MLRGEGIFRAGCNRLATDNYVLASRDVLFQDSLHQADIELPSDQHGFLPQPGKTPSPAVPADTGRRRLTAELREQRHTGKACGRFLCLLFLPAVRLVSFVMASQFPAIGVAVPCPGRRQMTPAEARGVVQHTITAPSSPMDVSICPMQFANKG